MIALMPDSQWGVYQNTLLWPAEYNFIADNAAELGIKIVLSTGDYTQNHNAEEFARVSNAYDAFDARDLPYLPTIGNHDYSEADRGASLYHGLFHDRMTSKDWWNGGVYEVGKADNCYQIMSIDGNDYIFVSVEFGPRQAVLDWLNALLATHASKKAIIITHSFTFIDGTRVGTGDANNPHLYWATDTHDGEEMWAEIKHNDNLLLVLSGHHIYGEAHLEEDSDGGKPVSQVFINYQAEIPDGTVRFITINPTAKTIYHQTFRPINGIEDETAAGKFTTSYE